MARAKSLGPFAAAARPAAPVDLNVRRVFAIRWNVRERDLAADAAKLTLGRYTWNSPGRPLAEFVRLAVVAVSRRMLGLPLDQVEAAMLAPASKKPAAKAKRAAKKPTRR